MPSSGLWHHVGLMKTYVLVECLVTLLLAQRFFYPDDGGNVPHKCWFSHGLHGATSQKMALGQFMFSFDLNFLIYWLFNMVITVGSLLICMIKLIYLYTPTMY
jgi:hypothetical protein